MPEPQDIFEKLNENDNPVKAAPRQRAPLAPQRPPPSDTSQGSKQRWLMLSIGAGILVVGIAATVVFRLRTETTNNENRNTSSENTNVATQSETTETVVVNGVSDGDRDGLLDAEETQQGTKADLADTDRDGLGDGEEVRVYKTNPLKPDTDGDGNADGAEVKKGYNPNGPGQLLNFEAARQELTK